MKIYIRATGNISPQHTFGEQSFPETVVETTGNRLACVEPDYKNFIDPKLIRRMSRIIKMGVSAALECLRNGGVENPDAIITGTAYGCLEDSVSFLSKMVEFNEEFLAPTAFIQSTHNTVGAQIALSLQCHGYNNTFVHRGFSFESALLDAVMLIKEGDAGTVLTGGLDEITNASHQILSRLGLYKREPVSNLQLYATSSRGTIAGEGAAFFLLSNEASDKDVAVFDGCATFYKPQRVGVIKEEVLSFLASQDIGIDDVDIVVSGRNGDASGDEVYNELEVGIFSKKRIVHYKHLCGEYPTSSAFALWMATEIVKKEGKRVLIYNHSNNIHHSLMLVSKA